MDGTEILIILLVLAIIGVVAYFVYAFIQNKEETDKDIKDTIGMVHSEQADRVSNIKYVVDEVNNVNSAIYTAWSTSNAALQSSLNGQQSHIGTINSNIMTINSNVSFINSEWTGFGSIIGFSNSSGALKIQDLPGVTPGGVNINLLGNVVATMGLNGSNLTNFPVTLCGADPSRCIKFPDKVSGDTYLTTLDSTRGKIKLDAATLMTGQTTVNGMFTTSNMVQFCTSPAVGGSPVCSSFNNGSIAPNTMNLLNGGTSNVGTFTTDTLKIGNKLVSIGSNNTLVVT